MTDILPSQPEGYFSLLKRSLQLYRAAFWKVLFVTLLFAITTCLPDFISVVIGPDTLTATSILNPKQLWVLLINLVAIFFFIAVLWGMQCVIRNRHEPLIEDFDKAIHKLPPVFFAALIQFGILYLVGVIFEGADLFILHENYFSPTNYTADSLVLGIITLEIILSIYIYLYFCFYLPIIAIENKGIIISLEKSILLVWGNWWRTLLFQGTPWLFYILVLLALQNMIGLNLLPYYPLTGTQALPTLLVRLFVFACFVPWFAANLLIQLRDLELRKHLTR